MQSQFFPGCFSVAINGRANQTVQFQDLNTNFIVFVTAKTWKNENTGINQPVFELWYQEQNALTQTTYLFPRTEGQGVGAFLAVVNSWASANDLFQYNSWIEINYRPIGTAKDVLINDNYVRRRVYKTKDGGQTDIYIGVTTALDDQIITVSGNATKSLTYYYNYSWIAA